MDMHLRRVLAYLRAEKGASEHTRRAYRGNLTRLDTYLSEQDKHLRSATLLDIRAWLSADRISQSNRKPLSAASMARRISSVGFVTVSLRRSMIAI